MLHYNSLLFLFSALSAVVYAAALPAGQAATFYPSRANLNTNAERFSRGLGPAKPKHLYSSTRTLSAREAGSSPLPPLRLQVIAASGSDMNAPLGYVVSGSGGFANIGTRDNAIKLEAVNAGPNVGTRLASVDDATASMFINNGNSNNPPYFLAFAAGLNDQGAPGGKFVQTSIFGGPFASGEAATVSRSPTTGDPTPVLFFIRQGNPVGQILPGYFSEAQAKTAIGIDARQVRFQYDRTL